MSGGLNCATTDPSTNSTNECTIDCGCTTTEIFSAGISNSQCASTTSNALFISERTVKFHVSAILDKLGAGNRTEAVTLAAQRGLLSL